MLTPKGRALRKHLVPLAEAVNSVAVRNLKSADIAITRKVLLAIIENMAADELGAEMRMPSTRELARLGSSRLKRQADKLT